ncbi:MAG: recA protein [Bdellovibrionales bacterium]|nr:recA protein [Bdellovibrionales bacterium]
MSEAALNKLKIELGSKLRTPEQVIPAPGLSTGWSALDRYLLWQGFPKSAVSLMISSAGGATSLWIRSVAHLTKSGHWAAWINNGESHLTPWMLRYRGVDLSKLLVVSQPKDGKQLLWAMQELMSLCLFETVACDLGQIHLREHQILKLKRLAMRYQTAVVLITPTLQVRRSSFYSLILSFEKDQVTVHRALHRQSPFILERKDLYADTLPLLAAGRRALCG